MGDDVNVFDGTVWKQQTVFKIRVLSVAGCAIECLSHGEKVFWMDSLEHAFQCRFCSFVVLKDAKRLLRPEQLFAGQIPSKTAREAQPLCLGQIGFAAAERLV